MIKNISSPGERMTNERAELERALSAVTKRYRDGDSLARPGKFPGEQPVTFQHEHLNEVKRKGSYVVCEKSDGARFLLLLLARSSYLVNTKMEFFRVNPPLPINHDQVKGTLLDGELVIDEMDPGNPSRNETNFYVFDSISIKNVFVGDLSLLDRLRVAAGEILVHLNYSHIRDPQSQVPMHLKLKKMYPAFASRHIWENIVLARQLHHESDGLIFTKDQAAYVAGTVQNAEILKWKPPHLNSVDFGIGTITAIGESGEVEKRFARLYWGAGNSIAEYPDSCILLEPENQERLQALSKSSGKDVVICECFWDTNWYQLQPPATANANWSERELTSGGGWRFMRLREDKLKPNFRGVVESVIYSIRNPVTEQSLFQALEE